MMNTMRLYDATCPMCGKINRALILDETDGWMECIRCGFELHLCDKENFNKIPAFDPGREAWLTRYAG